MNGRRRSGSKRAGVIAASIAAAGLLVSATTASAQTPGTPPTPISSAPTTAPGFLGAPANLKSVKRGFKVPSNPFMAPNGRSNLHNDAYQTDTYLTPGPS